MPKRLNHAAAVLLTLTLASLTGPYAHAIEESERVAVGDAINAIYRTACQLHCKKRSIDECVRNCFEQYFDVVQNDSDDVDLKVCREAGGVLRARINPCAQSIAKLIDLSDDSKLSETFGIMAEVEQHCTSQVLCDATPDALPNAEIQP